jgi:hypothetical protein
MPARSKPLHSGFPRPPNCPEKNLCTRGSGALDVVAKLIIELQIPAWNQTCLIMLQVAYRMMFAIVGYARSAISSLGLRAAHYPEERAHQKPDIILGRGL